MVALGRELMLRRLRVVEVERVLDRHRDELRDVAEERDVCGGIRHGIVTPEPEHADPSASGREWQDAEASDALLSTPRDGVQPARLSGDVADDERLLRLDDPAHRRVFGRDLESQDDIHTRGIEDLRVQHPSLRVVERHADAVEADDPLQLSGQLAEELVGVATRRHRLGDGQQRLKSRREAGALGRGDAA